MTYYYPPGAQVAAIPAAVSEKPGIYGPYNGQIHATPMQIPTQRPPAVAGAPIIQQGPPMPHPGGPPPNIGLAGASPLTTPSPLTAATPGASPLQPGATSLPPQASPYPTSITSSAPTFIPALPAGMYAPSGPGLYQGPTVAYHQPAHTVAPAVPTHPQTLATNPYIGRPIQHYVPMVPHSAPTQTQGPPIHTMPIGPGSQIPAGYPGLAQAPPPPPQVFSHPPAGYGIQGQMPPTIVYASHTQAPPQMPPGAMPSPYPQHAMIPAAGAGLSGPQPGASFPRPPSMP